jgi:hypothetical protein
LLIQALKFRLQTIPDLASTICKPYRDTELIYTYWPCADCSIHIIVVLASQIIITLGVK